MLKIPKFAQNALAVRHCTCKTLLCEHTVEEVGLRQTGDEKEPQFFLLVRCLKCKKACYVIARRPAGWLEFAIEIFASEFPSVVAKIREKRNDACKLDFPITDAEVVDMRDRLRAAKSDGDLLGMMGLRPEDLAQCMEPPRDDKKK